jgi:hypothetical protein
MQGIDEAAQQGMAAEIADKAEAEGYEDIISVNDDPGSGERPVAIANSRLARLRSPSTEHARIQRMPSTFLSRCGTRLLGPYIYSMISSSQVRMPSKWHVSKEQH